MDFIAPDDGGRCQTLVCFQPNQSETSVIGTGENSNDLTISLENEP
jgi:hypothetical protein